MEQTSITASPRLRAAFVLVAVIVLALWCWSLVPAVKAIRDPRGDGFDIIPAFWATILLLPIGIMTLIGGVTGHGKHVARARVALIIAVGLAVLAVLLEVFRRLSMAIP